MGIKERKTREKEELRLKILFAAADLITENGIENLSIRKLASRIDYSPRTVYLYFRDKDDILYHLVEHGFTVTLEALEQLKHSLPENAGNDSFFILEKMLRRHISIALSSPNHYRVVFEVLQKSSFSPGPAQMQIEKNVFHDVALCMGLNPESLSDKEKEDAGERVFLLFSVLRGFAISLIKSAHDLGTDQVEKMTDRFIDMVKRCLFKNNGE